MLEKNANKLLISMNIMAMFIVCGVEQTIKLERKKVQKKLSTYKVIHEVGKTINMLMRSCQEKLPS